MKVSTNTALYETKKHWIDFNAGELLEDVQEDVVLEKFISTVIDVASGKRLNHEKTILESWLFSKQVSHFKATGG